MLERLARRIWSCPLGAAELILWPLSLLSLLYRSAALRRANRYLSGAAGRTRLDVPVISVGNIEVGGGGKTPMVIGLAEALTDLGCRVGILTRGYGGSNEGRGALLVADRQQCLAGPDAAGDEAVLMARRLPGVPVVACARRAQGAEMLLALGNIDLVLLDDAFQHLQLERDLDLVMVDGRAPFGNGCTLPRGPLREPPSALGRADLIVARVAADEAAGVTRDLKSVLAAWTDAPLWVAETVVDGMVDPRAVPGALSTLADLPADAKLIAVSGIARPERLDITLAGLGLRPLAHRVFPDHHPYRPRDVASVAAQVRDAGADAVVTTEKDWVKLAPLWPAHVRVWIVKVSLSIRTPAEADGAEDWAAECLRRATEHYRDRR